MNITWKPVVDGNDIIIGDFTNPVTASWFGGPSDSGDDGQTASGVPNHTIGVLGCAMPMRISNGKHVADCADSPFENIPWQTMVTVSSLIKGPSLPIVGSVLTIPVIDVGPATHLNRPIDLTPFVFVRLGGDLKVGLLHCFIRIINGAKYLK